MVSIRPFIWFDRQAEEARDFYLSVFRNGETLDVKQFGQGVLSTVDFALEGLRFTGLNTGTTRSFNEAISFFIETADQAETNYYWNALTADGGSEKPCGWLTDKFGVYWQVAPTILTQLASDPDREKAERVLQAMYKMKKIIIADLEAAYNGQT